MRGPGRLVAALALVAVFAAVASAGGAVVRATGWTAGGAAAPPFGPAAQPTIDTDGDGCPDALEIGPSHELGGQRDPLSPWDFFDVPVPVLNASDASGTRNHAVTLADVIAVLYYTGTKDRGAPNANGVQYNTDLDGNGVADGSQYDRTSSTDATMPWRSGPPNGVVSIADVIVALAQVGDTCAGSTASPTATATETPTDAATATTQPGSSETPTPTAIATATDTATPTVNSQTSATATATPTPTATDTAGATATDTPVSTATDTATPTRTNTATPTITNTPVPTATDTPTNTATPTATSTPRPTNTAAPTATSTATPTNTASATATRTATMTATPSRTATPTPTRTATNTATATNTPAAAVTGQWSTVAQWPLYAVHMALLHDGNVLIWDSDPPTQTMVKTWNPATNVFTNEYINTGLFCAGHSQLTDGRVIVVGGHNGAEVGIKGTNIFDPATGTWATKADMHYARWYPSSTTLPDGRVVALSGNITPNIWADTPEIYDPTTNTWTTLPTINTSDMHEGGYPLSFLLPNGKIFSIGAAARLSRLLDVSAPSWTVGPVPSTAFGSAAMYRPGKFLYAGGGPSWSAPSVGTASVIDMTGAPTAHAVQSMSVGRFQHNLVVLADGNVLAEGGANVVDALSKTGTRTVELWNATTETWSTMAPVQDLRMYHSTALLMPDARVLVAGGDYSASETAEIFSPPYLFRGPRPVIANAPASTSYGGTMLVDSPDAGSIASVALVPFGSNTHTLNMNQTYIPLSFTAAGTQLSVQAPTNMNIATPGYYMMFIVNSNGVPSMAATVSLGGGAGAFAAASTSSANPGAAPATAPSVAAAATDAQRNAGYNTADSGALTRNAPGSGKVFEGPASQGPTTSDASPRGLSGWARSIVVMGEAVLRRRARAP